ncbi:RHS repeat-associated core domain-containing protein [Brucella sp. H1_1004]|uniref:RHS repeat domain-containing protein n=1 Tax=Brucella sp. H1_1004 TaxID=3110109 RepID=UPI0039B54DE4
MQKMYNYCGDIDYTLKIADLPGIEGTSGASLKQEFIYDGLHLKSGYKFPINGSGQIVSSTFNPNTISSTVKNNAFTNYMTEENDIVNNIIKTTTFTDDGSEVHSLVKQLDVYGTLKSIVENITGAEEVKDTTYLSEFTSDFLGRPQSYTLPDGTVLAIEYDTRFIRPLVTKVTYTLLDEKKLTLLECSYNDRGLISQRSLIGRDLKYPHFYSYEYDVAYSRVKKETKPDRKTTINYIYDDNLGGRLTTIQTSDNISQIFSYNRLGQISSITEKSNGNNQVVIMRKLDALGRVVSERYQYSSNLYAITENTYIGSTNYLSSKTDANGLTTYYYYDEFMRLVRLENVHMRTDFSYDKYSRLEVQKSWPILTWNTDNQTGQIDDSKCYSLTKGYDEKTGYITSLIEKSPSSNPTILEMTYRSDGRLTKRTYGPQDPNSIRTRVENYKYDNRKRLIQYNCDGTSFVTDETGNNVKKQDYKYDDINNIKEITTTYIENGVDVNSTTTFNYTNNNPFLVESIVKDNGSPISILYDLAYDRALNDDQGRKFTYDTMERLSSVSDANGSTSFVYDGTNSLRRQLEQDNNIRCFFYDGFKVNAEFTLDAASNKNNKISRIYSLAGFIGQTDPDDIFRFILVDSFDTPIYGEEGSDKLSTATTPFGSSYKPSLTTPSYRGEVYNSALGGYFLGRGYRLYNPRIARFNMPDSYGPHTAAGVNPFAYAHNDPVNYSDPTGHTPQGSNASNKKLLGVVVGIAVVESALIVGSFVLGPLTVGAAIQASVSLAILGGATYEGVKASEDWNSNPSKAATELTFAAMGFFAAYSVGFNAKNFDADHVIPKQVVSSGSKKADDFELAKIKSEESLVQKIIRRSNKIPYFQIPEDKPELFAGLRTATSDDLVEFHEHDIPNGAYKTAEGNVCLQQRDNIDLITGSEFNPVTENPILTPEAANDLNQNFNLPTNRSSDLYVNASMGDDRSRNGSITSGYSTQPGESVFASYDLQQMRSITYLSVRF